MGDRGSLQGAGRADELAQRATGDRPFVRKLPKQAAGDARPRPRPQSVAENAGCRRPQPAARLPFDAPIAKRPLAPLLPTHLDDAPYVRTTSTAKLVMDAELRSRIEVQGITGGLLGDPMPGRSALDRKRAGEIESPTWMDGRAARFIPKITLPTGPLR